MVRQQGAEADGRTPMVGDLALNLDGNKVRVQLDGHFREEQSGHLLLQGAEGSLSCNIDAYGICRGQLRWGSEVLPFALVHMGQ